MNKLLLSIMVTMLIGLNALAQTKVSGVVKNATTNKEVYNLTVTLVETGETVQTDRIGYFQFVNVKNGNYTIKITGESYDVSQKNISVNGESRIDLGTLPVVFNPTNVNIGVITLTDDELSSDESSAQSAVGLLQSSRDVFASTAAYELGAYWFKIRGYDNKYNDVFFNGIRMNKINNDRVNFGDWGGLNDVTRYPAEQTLGAEPSTTAFGDVGGVTNFDTRPSRLRTGTSLAYSFTNRSYNQRVVVTHNTGLNKKGWGFMASGARRWAEEGPIDGTFYDSWAYYLGIEKKINDKHTVNLTAFGAPTRRTGNSPNTQEIYDLMGKDYNAYWGWQDGEKRNERVRNFHQPIAMLTHHWDINRDTKLTTTAAYQFGFDSRSRLDWFKANNPSPLYYRNFPSFYASQDGATDEEVEAIRDLWRNDQTYSQIDWADIYSQNANRKGGGAAYVLAADKNEDRTISFNTNLRTKLADNIDFIAAANYQNTTSQLYREVLDLLGANYYVNRNAFQKISFNIDEDPNRKVLEGDRYQYDYEINRQFADVFFQSKITYSKFDITLGVKAAYTSYYRDGKYRHEQYQNNSKGKSKTYDFLDFGTKAQVQYKIDGRNFIQLNGMYSAVAPTADEVFPNARSNNFTIDNYIINEDEIVENANNLKSSKLLSADLSYILRASRLKGRLTGYYTKFYNEVEKNFGYIDAGGGSGNLFGAEYLYNVDKLFIGGEFALEAQLTTTLSLSAVASIGQFTYNNNPTYQRFSDSEVVVGQESFTAGAEAPQTVYLKNYKVAVGPQQGFSLGLEYRDPHYWWVGATGNYLANNYLDPAPYRRTTGFVTNPVTESPYDGLTDEVVKELLKQEKFSNEFMLNINAGKTFRFGKYYMGISANINNVLDNRNYVTGGFEQTRIGSGVNALDPNQQKIFGPRYWYDRGRSYFINAFFRF